MAHNLDKSDRKPPNNKNKRPDRYGATDPIPIDVVYKIKDYYLRHGLTARKTVGKIGDPKLTEKSVYALARRYNWVKQPNKVLSGLRNYAEKHHGKPSGAATGGKLNRRPHALEADADGDVMPTLVLSERERRDRNQSMAPQAIARDERAELALQAARKQEMRDFLAQQAVQGRSVVEKALMLTTEAADARDIEAMQKASSIWSRSISTVRQAAGLDKDREEAEVTKNLHLHLHGSGAMANPFGASKT